MKLLRKRIRKLIMNFFDHAPRLSDKQVVFAVRVIAKSASPSSILHERRDNLLVQVVEGHRRPPWRARLADQRRAQASQVRRREAVTEQVIIDRPPGRPDLG